MSRIERIGPHTLYLGDCREILPTLGPVAAVVTDPPYGIGIARNPIRQKHASQAWDDAVPGDDIFAALNDLSVWQIIWGGNYFGLPPRACFLVWDKVQPQDFTLSMCEQAWTNLDGPAKLFRRHVVSFQKDHPTQKPLELMEWCLDRLPEPNESVLDPFMGSGTTGVACVKRGKAFTGIERDPAFFDIACRRIEAAMNQPDLFIPQPKAKAEQLSLLGDVAP